MHRTGILLATIVGFGVTNPVTKPPDAYDPYKPEPTCNPGETICVDGWNTCGIPFGGYVYHVFLLILLALRDNSH